MQILVIGYVWPEPNSSAAGSRMMQLLHSFHQQNWPITFASPAQLSDHMADLSEYNINVTQIELNNDSFDRFIDDLQPNIVIFDRFMMEEQFAWRVEKCCPDALRVLNTEDLHSLRHGRHQAVKTERPFQLKDMYSDLGVREIAAIHRSDLTLMISEYETQLLKDEFQVPESHLMYLPFMLEEAPQSTALPLFEERQHFVTIGNFRHAPNWDAVRQLKTHIWPKIRQALPTTELHIYGAYPPPKASQLHNPKQGFHIKGWAEDAKQVISQARICLAPIRFGAGIKGKLVEAMQVGTPSITTKIGAEAMAGPWPWNGVITDDVDEFVAAAVSLYQDQASWQLMQNNGFSILNARFQRNEWQNKLIQRLLRQVQLKDVLRDHHFWGKMLRHHSLKSTQYMSQWIALKNQQETSAEK
ncbi:glycosyltransferase [Marinomonas sp. THO17]|uniref:glycosyltransferase n=1 Tax=Marinomonas sp. THO17 TaxID=3149048 RepID=UPI00336BF0D8